MYLEYYGLKESPFNLVTEPRFLFYSESHCEAMAHLLYGVRERKGVMLMLGEAGTGKTSLVRATLGLLQQTRVVSSLILNPMLSNSEELLDAVLRGFNQAAYKRTALDMMEYLQVFLRQQSRRGKIPVLILDEAQDLSPQLLEQLRLLSNFEADGHRALQIILSGQPELNDTLLKDQVRALRQRISVRCRLLPLTGHEIWKYLNYRLIVAGGDGHVIFSPEAVQSMYVFSGGIPRVLNAIADNCLLAGFSQNRPAITEDIVEMVARHLELRETDLTEVQSSTLQQEIIRASSSWAEISRDLRQAGVPAALKTFIEKLQQEESAIATFRMNRAVGVPSA
jgi:general secretion pathway protein A